MNSRQLAATFALMAKHGVTELEFEGVRIVRPASVAPPAKASLGREEKPPKRKPIDTLLAEDVSLRDRINGMS